MLVASDNRMLKLASPLGDEAAAAQTDRRRRRAGSRGSPKWPDARPARPVILQTLADDPDAIQFNMDLGLPGSPRVI